MNKNILQKIIFTLVFIKAIYVLAGAFGPIKGAHTFRQTDTMGVTLSYWLRWTSSDFKEYLYLPAVLNAGDAHGYTPMELPVLNLITIPGFILGADYGRYAAMLLHSLILLALLFWHHRVWRDIKIYDQSLQLLSPLILIFGVFQIYFDKYIPDVLAFLLISLAIGLSWKQKRSVLSFALTSLALMIKPPVVFALGLYFIRGKKTFLEHFFYWMLPSIVLGVLYFKLNSYLILTYFPGTNAFATYLRNPISALGEFFADPYGIYRLFTKNIFTVYLFIPILIDIALKKYKKISYPLWPLWIILVLQTIGSGALVGINGFFHEYYFISTTFIAILIFIYFLNHGQRQLVMVSMLALSLYTVERGYYALRPHFKNDRWAQCREINKLIPTDVVKIGSIVTLPVVGVCMSKIEGSAQSNWFVLDKRVSVIPPGGEFQQYHETKDFIVYKRD